MTQPDPLREFDIETEEIALAALRRRNAKLERENRKRDREIDELGRRLDALEAKVRAINAAELRQEIVFAPIPLLEDEPQ